MYDYCFAMADDSEARLREAAGIEDLSKVRELELIFADCKLAEHLHRLCNLVQLRLIDTKLRSMPNLAPVSATLTSLTLTKQPLESMAGLPWLPCLTELFLHRNQLARIEGLQACPKLRRLWLTDNKIAAMEGLENLGDLRELRVQGNRISKLCGLEGCSALRTLDMSRNLVAKPSELSALRSLPHLRELFLSHPAHGSCPAALADDYRSFAICTLKELRMLDGAAVRDEERSAAEDAFLSRSLEFNDTVEALHRAHREELRAVESQRLRSLREAEELKAQLLAQFFKLRDVVAAGRDRIRKEQARQLALREHNVEHLKQQLAAARAEHKALLDALAEEERRQMAAEERGFAHLSRRARLELNESVTAAEMAQGLALEAGGAPAAVRGRVALQVLCNDAVSASSMSPELKALCLALFQAQPEGLTERLLVYRASKVFNASLYEEHVKAAAAAAEAGVAAGGGGGARRALAAPGGAVLTLFVGVPDLATLKRVLMLGLAELAVAGAVVLCPDPRTAARLAGSSGDARGMYRVVQCRVALGRVHDLRAGADALQALPNAAAHLAALPADCCAARLEAGHAQARFAGPESAGVAPEQVYLLRAPQAALALPTAYCMLAAASWGSAGDGPADEGGVRPVSGSGALMLVQEEGLDSMVQQVADRVAAHKAGLSPKVEEHLQRLEAKIDNLLSQYEERVRQELDPATAERVEAAEAQADGLEAQLGGVRERIDKEKARQEQILRDFEPGAKR